MRFDEIFLDLLHEAALREWVKHNDHRIPRNEVSGFLYQAGLIEMNTHDPGRGSFRVTARSKSYLNYIDQYRESEEKKDRQQRFQNQVSVASVLVPAVTFVLGLVVEHFTGLVSFILEFLRNGIE